MLESKLDESVAALQQKFLTNVRDDFRWGED